MKKLIIAAVFLSVSITLFCQSDKYVGAMQKNITAIDTSFKNPANLLTLANNFERIANAEKTQWLAYYYSALCQVNYAFTQMQGNMSAVDAIADKANSLISKADSLQPNNSEISCIKSMIATCHMIVDPMTRWQQYGQEIEMHNAAAVKQDPANPRPHYLKGENLKGTPEQFGGGCAAAKPELQKALELFNAFKPASELHPNWGKQRVEMLLNECK
jgi:hypothetical protein